MIALPLHSYDANRLIAWSKTKRFSKNSFLTANVMRLLASYAANKLLEYELATESDSESA